MTTTAAAAGSMAAPFRTPATVALARSTVALTAGSPTAELSAAARRAGASLHVSGDDHPHDFAPIRDVARRGLGGLQIVVGILRVERLRRDTVVVANFAVVQIVVRDSRGGRLVGRFGPRRSWPLVATTFSSALATPAAPAAPPTARPTIGCLVLLAARLAVPICLARCFVTAMQLTRAFRCQTIGAITRAIVAAIIKRIGRLARFGRILRRARRPRWPFFVAPASSAAAPAPAASAMSRLARFRSPLIARLWLTAFGRRKIAARHVRIEAIHFDDFLGLFHERKMIVGFRRTALFGPSRGPLFVANRPSIVPSTTSSTAITPTSIASAAISVSASAVSPAVTMARSATIATTVAATLSIAIASRPTFARRSRSRRRRFRGCSSCFGWHFRLRRGMTRCRRRLHGRGRFGWRLRLRRNCDSERARQFVPTAWRRSGVRFRRRRGRLRPGRRGGGLGNGSRRFHRGLRSEFGGQKIPMVDRFRIGHDLSKRGENWRDARFFYR